MPIDFQRVQGVFQAVAELPPAERGTALDRECGGDAELRQQVEALLRAHDDSGELPAAEPEPTGPYVPAVEPGQLFAGRYKLREKLGQGGMGVVFVADQTAPVQRRVALKVIRAGLDTHRLLARFEQERQALALMDHPNIAKILDAGMDETGRPYFAMELVKGLPLTKYCDDARLSPRQRLELFIPVCQAVQHAHQKGVIHRDLKPSNILVGLYDGRPVPKVIDFGVAKATGPRLTEQSVYTEVGSIVGTLEYMSPEQAELNNLDIDTRSDVYALGVILYELLTGAVPFSRKDLERAGLAEMLRVIKEIEPPKPSMKLSHSGTLPSIAARRQTEPHKLTALVRGELDWIVMKALEKDRNRRYETANGLALEVQRYLADEPVMAGPPTIRYRLRKFVTRNKGLVAALSLILLCLLGGIISTSAGLVWAVRERDDKAKALLAETEAKEAEIRAGEAKEKALDAETKARAAERQARDKALAALRSMTDEIVENQMARGTTLTEENRAFLRKIIEQFEGLAAITADDADSRAIRADGRDRVGVMRARLGELKEAETAFVDALTVRKKLAAEFPNQPELRRDLASTQGHLGLLLDRTSRPREAEAAYSDALALERQLAADFPARPDFRDGLAKNLSNLGGLLQRTGRLGAAETAYTDALTIFKQLAAEFPNRPECRQALATSHNNLGVLFSRTGRFKEAESAFADALAIQKQLAADFPTRPEFRLELARSHNNLGLMLSESDTSRLREAESAYADALAVQKQLAADFPTRPELRQELARSHNNLGNLLQRTGRLEAAETAYADAQTLQKRLAADFPTRPDFGHELANSHTNLGDLFSTTGRLKEAETAYADALALRKQLCDLFPNQPDMRDGLAITLGSLARLCNQRRDFKTARTYLEQALPHNQAALNANPRNPMYQEVFARNLVALVGANAGLQDQTAALEAAQKLRDLGWNPPVNAYNAACVLSLCIPFVEKDDRLDAAKRQAAVQFYGDAAMKLLREAVSKGFKDVAHMKKDTDLGPLRQREDFQKLVAEMEAKGK